MLQAFNAPSYLLMTPILQVRKFRFRGDESLNNRRATHKFNSITPEPKCLMTTLHGLALFSTFHRKLPFSKPNTEQSIV